MTDYLVDTDVLIDHLRGARLFALPDGSSGAYSIITRAELNAGRRAESQPINALLSQLDEVALTSRIAMRAGEIKRVTSVGLADAIVAATALESGRIVMTRNRKHFERVEGLEIVADPMEETREQE